MPSLPNNKNLLIAFSLFFLQFAHPGEIPVYQRGVRGNVSR